MAVEASQGAGVLAGFAEDAGQVGQPVGAFPELKEQPRRLAKALGGRPSPRRERGGLAATERRGLTQALRISALAAC